MTVLVTGATGFVGSAVARALLARGNQVRVLARPGSDRRNLAGLELEVVSGDLGDPGSLAPAVAGCEALYHVAADYRLWVPKPEQIYRTNVAGTRALMRAAAEAGVARIVYTSSVATLGHRGDGGPADEATPVTLEDMIGHYKRSKFLAEAEVQRLIDDEALPVVTVNPSTPVGPRDIKPTPTGRMIIAAAAGKMPAYVDTGLNIVHVDDVAAGHLLAFERGRLGERYVLGGEDLSLKRILGAIAGLCGRRPPRLKLSPAVVMPIAAVAELWARVSGREPMTTRDAVRMSRKTMYFSSDKAKRELGYAPGPAAQALKSAVAWFRAHGYLG